MNDDLGKKLKQITDVLSQENLPDNLKGLLSLLAGPGGKDEQAPGQSDAAGQEEEKSGNSGSEDGDDLANKIRGVIERLNVGNDPRVNLLRAVRPFLNRRRQKRLDDCMKLLSISRMVKYMDDFDKLNT